MASTVHSGRLQNAVKYHRKVRKTGPNCRKRLVTGKWCEIRQKISAVQRKRRLQISRVKNIARVFELDGARFAVPPCGGLLVRRRLSCFLPFVASAVSELLVPNNFRLEVTSDVISGVDVEDAILDVCVHISLVIWSPTVLELCDPFIFAARRSISF